LIPLLIGVVALFAARRALRGEDVHPARWVALIAGLTLLQLWLGRDALTRYRVTLLGLRHAVAAEQGMPRQTSIRVSGDYDEADIYVPAAGGGDIAVLEPRGDSAVAQVVAAAAEDASAVVAVEESGRFGRPRWRVLGATPLAAGDTIVVRGGGRVYALAVDEVPDTLSLGGVGVPLPWTERHALVDVEGGRVVLPAARHQPLRRMRGAQPSVFARAYPLADIVQAVDPSAGALPALASFLYYDDGRLTLADLDGEVDGPRAAEALPVWSSTEGGRRLLVAGLPLRDYREQDLTLPERYGVRPLRTFRFELHGRWLDALFATPEIQAFDRAAMAALRLPRDEAGTPVYRVRISHARHSMVREAIVFDAPPRAFAAGSQAILALPEDARAGAFDIVTPSGTARWATGRPLPLGTSDRALLVRVDGQATSAGFWLVHALLFAAIGGMLWARRTRGVPLAVAVLGTGLLSVRLLLGVTALLEFPFVGEGHQIGLWLLPVLPWAIVVASEIAERWHDRKQPDPALRLHGAYATGMVGLSLVVFAGSPAKQLVLAIVPIGLFALRAVTARRRLALPPMPRLRTHVGRLPAWARSGVALGVLLLIGRVLLDFLGWREGVRIGGTRIAVSVLYTPVALCALAWLVRRWDVRIRDTATGGDAAATARTALHALVSIGGFLACAFVAVAAWISDFGIVLVGLPGVLLLVAALGVRWAPADLQGRLVRLAYVLPLLLFVLLQSAPTLLVPSAAEVARSDVRMSEWNRNELLLLERGDPHSLRLIGQRRSEALAVMRETMRSYTRGNWFGRGFLDGRVSHEIQDTATREHAVSALLAAQWGLAGTAGLVLLLLGMLAPVSGMAPDAERSRRVRTTARDAALLLAAFVVAAAVLPTPYDVALVLLASAALLVAAGTSAFADGRSDPAGEAQAGKDTRPLPFAGIVSALALLVFATAGLYMVLANYGLVFFTGKNVYLLGLDSVSDALEGLLLLVLGAAGAAWLPAPVALLRAARPVALPRRPPRALPRGTPVPMP
jgi:hypothetical protein